MAKNVLICRTLVISIVGLIATACSGAAAGSRLHVGTEPGIDGGLSAVGNAGAGAVPSNAGVVVGLNALTVHVEDRKQMTITVVTIACAGECADVEAVAMGGHAPYAFAWEDGSTSANRRVCPDASTHYAVTATDTAISGGEFPYPAHTAAATVTANLVSAICSDAGVDAGVQGSTIIVPGISDIWLAGQMDGATLADQVNGGMDVAPTNSRTAVPVVPGSTLSFSVTGATSNIGNLCFGASPDGGCLVALAIPQASANGISILNASLNALVGVFLGAGIPSGQAPVALDGKTDFATLSPQLQQAFFIGDGLTGTGNGSVQHFVVPAGATRLFLASSDALGGSYNNSGQFSVVVSTL